MQDGLSERLDGPHGTTRVNPRQLSLTEPNPAEIDFKIEPGMRFVVPADNDWPQTIFEVLAINDLCKCPEICWLGGFDDGIAGQFSEAELAELEWVA